ncbi:MAG: PrsW family glutamic-type intramembrane protease [Pirellulales bacterium]
MADWYVAWNRNKIDPMGVVLVGVFSGLGFAAFENMHYSQQSVVNSLLLTKNYGIEGLALGVQTAMIVVMLRSLSLVFCHAIWSGIASYFVAIAAVTKRRWGALLIVGVGTSAVLHGLYDWLTTIQLTFATFVVVISFVLFYAYVSKLRNLAADVTSGSAIANAESGVAT